MLIINETAEVIFKVFIIAALGYMAGRVRIKGISLGTAAVFLSGLVFGHMGWELSAELQNMGLILFITSVGFSAGPGFVNRIRKNGIYYIVICLSTAAMGSFLCAVLIRGIGMDAPLAVGIMTGAFTTSPGFAAAKEAVGTSAKAAARLAAGYGMSYPVGIICKVLFIQLIPRVLHADMRAERAKIKMPADIHRNPLEREQIQIGNLGLFPFCLAVAGGIMLGSVHIPLGTAASFSLGITGGPLIMGLLFSCIGNIKKIDLRCDNRVIEPFKEIGLVLFFSGAGTEGGRGVGGIMETYGFRPVFYSFVIVSVSLIMGFCIAYFGLKIPLLNGLGAMTASMTCTPSLAVLTQIAGTDDVAAAYAATYPMALVTLVLVVQFLVLL